MQSNLYYLDKGDAKNGKLANFQQIELYWIW